MLKEEKKDMRQHKRYPTKFTLEIDDVVKPGRKISAVVTDISEGGLCLETNQKMELGSAINFTVQVPLIVQGGVVRSENRESKNCYGVQFHNVRFQPMRKEFSKPRTMIRVPRQVG